VANGAKQRGVLEVGDLDQWTFEANAGDTLVVRAGGTNFTPWLQLLGPDGSLQAANTSSSLNNRDSEISLVATNSGTYHLLLSSYYLNATGGYQLSLAQSPGGLTIAAGDEGGPLTNGWRHTGTIEAGDLDTWQFSANVGDAVVVRMGGSTFTPGIRVYGPDGVLQAANSSSSVNNRDGEASFVVTNSGTFTVVVGAYYLNAFGDYILSLAQSPGGLTIAAGDEGGPLTNGWRHTGTIEVGGLDTWQFSANSGDAVVVRMGGSTLTPGIRVYGPNGVLQAANSSSSLNNRDGEASFVATNSGTFTVVVGAYYLNAFGDYILSLAQSPGGLTIATGDEGGPLTNGWRHTGTIEVGDLDAWQFSANAGDALVVRMGGSNFTPGIRIYGPNGVLQAANSSSNLNNRDGEALFRATNSGTFTVIADAYYLNGAGTYSLSLARSWGPISVTPGDQGGPMVGTASYAGEIEVGDADVWGFTGCVGERLALQVTGTNFTPRLRLYGPDGVLLAATSSSSLNTRTVSLAYALTNCGSFTLVASAYYLNGGGGYQLVNNGLALVMRLCPPRPSASTALLCGVGGDPGAEFVLHTSLDAANPRNLWTPIWTNRFDQYGVFDFSGLFDTADPPRFFLFSVP
jgi:hypothetical protein